MGEAKLEAVLAHMAKCPRYPDYPTAWAIQNAGLIDAHHPRCSSVPGWDPISGPSFLCDCGAVEKVWRDIKDKYFPDPERTDHEHLLRRHHPPADQGGEAG